MSFLNVFFPIMLYVLGATLLIVLIILGIKLINTVDKTNVLLDDVTYKVKTLDSIFNTVSVISTSLSTFGDKLVDIFVGLFSKITKKKKGRKGKNE